MQTARELDRRRRRSFFRFCAALVMVTFPGLMVINYLERDGLEMAIDLLIIAIMAGGLIVMKKSGADAFIYRVCFLLLSLSLFYSVLIGGGGGTAIFWAFPMPVLFFYFFGRREGAAWAALFYSGLVFILLAPHFFGGHAYGAVSVSRFLITLAIAIIMAYGLESSRLAFSTLLDEKNRVLLLEKQHLQKAMTEIKTLSGLIPICSTCKKIRNDRGYWEQVEVYVRDHSDVQFSHGICPDCIEALYPEYQHILKKKNPASS